MEEMADGGLNSAPYESIVLGGVCVAFSKSYLYDLMIRALCVAASFVRSNIHGCCCNGCCLVWCNR